MKRQLTWRVRMTVLGDSSLAALREDLEAILEAHSKVVGVKAECTGSLLLPED